MVTQMVTDYDQDGHVVGAHEEPVNSDSKDKPVPARRVDRLLATRSLPAPAPSHTTGHAGPHPAVRQAVGLRRCQVWLKVFRPRRFQ